MRWIKFPDGSSYTFAVDIQKFAEMNGYTVPCESDGTRHPGTDCNAKLRTIFRNAGMRRTFRLTESSVVEVRAEESFYNSEFINWLIERSIVSSSYFLHKSVQLYTREAVNALLSSMLEMQVEYKVDDEDREWMCPILVTKRSHSLEKGKNKPKVSLFKK